MAKGARRRIYEPVGCGDDVGGFLAGDDSMMVTML